MAISSSLAALVTSVAFVLDFVLFGIARHEFRKLGWSSQYGNAIWLTLVAQGAHALCALILHLNNWHFLLVQTKTLSHLLK